VLPRADGADDVVAVEAPGPAGDAAAPPASLRLFWWISLGIVVVDQITKALVRGTLPLYDSRALIPGLVDLVHVHNAGVAFGLLNDVAHPMRSVVTTTLAIVALAGIAYYARHIRREEHLARVGLSLILGGAIGNLADRLRQGYVVDFVDVYWRQWHFWAFNVADAAITIGAMLIFLELLLPSRHASHSV
jgi:signal peptidase II